MLRAMRVLSVRDNNFPKVLTGAQLGVAISPIKATS